MPSLSTPELAFKVNFQFWKTRIKLFPSFWFLRPNSTNQRISLFNFQYNRSLIQIWRKHQEILLKIRYRFNNQIVFWCVLTFDKRQLFNQNDLSSLIVVCGAHFDKKQSRGAVFCWFPGYTVMTCLIPFLRNCVNQPPRDIVYTHFNSGMFWQSEIESDGTIKRIWISPCKIEIIWNCREIVDIND